MYDYSNLYTLMERTVHKYNQFEKRKLHYADGVDITQAEIHTVACIGDNPGLNLTQLAEIKGISKSAASQMVYKLRDKGLVIKEVSKSSDAEIVINLTDIGRIAYESHKKYHETTTGHFFQILKQIPQDTAGEMESILQEFDKALDEMINKNDLK